MSVQIDKRLDELSKRMLEAIRASLKASKEEREEMLKDKQVSTYELARIREAIRHLEERCHEYA